MDAGFAPIKSPSVCFHLYYQMKQPDDNKQFRYGNDKVDAEHGKPPYDTQGLDKT